MYDLLKDMRVVEGSAFIAAPLCGLTLAQYGAEVIRVDAIGGGPDYNRWPLAPDGKSLYWMGLNKGKKSIALNMRHPEGRELATNIITAPGKRGGYFVTNFPVDGFLSHEKLAKKRADLVSVRVMGNPDGKTAVDYTVNSAIGDPDMRGAVEAVSPVNHVLPSWDLITGMTAAFALLAAAKSRQDTGNGVEVRIPLSDIALSMTANLGVLGEAALGNGARPEYGNSVYGAFGRDFKTADGRRVMIVALTKSQWVALIKAMEIEPQVMAIEKQFGVDLFVEGNRFFYRDQLEPLVGSWVSKRPFQEVARCLDDESVCWGPYQTIGEALEHDPRCSLENPMFQMMAQPGTEEHLTSGSPITLQGVTRKPVKPAPLLGQHTDQILTEVLGMSSAQIGRLHDKGLVSGSRESD